MSAVPSPIAKPSPTRAFGRFALRQLIGKSAATMAWLAHDPAHGEDMVLTLPRTQPADAAALAQWLSDARLAARLNHPQLAPVVEIGVQDHWPFIAVAAGRGAVLPDWMEQHPNLPPEQAVLMCCNLLEGLAFAHDAGVAHHDLQLHAVLVDERGGASVMALGASVDSGRRTAESGHTPSHGSAMAMDPSQLRGRRAAAARDVLACGLLLHRLLAGQHALGQADLCAAIDQMAPAGRELVRLPWSTPLPVPDALRAIANRCTSSQERLRYQNGRTLLVALRGWRDSHVDADRGPVGTLLRRIAAAGHLPALPGIAARVSRITSAEGQRTDQMAAQVLPDIALSLELLRTLNSVRVQGTQVAGDPPVLTLRRIIALIGVYGVRDAARLLRPWPGALAPAAAAALMSGFERAQLAGHTAKALRPAGYDAQVVHLIAVLQSLGRLLLRYHFADEAQQIEQLMQPVPAPPGSGQPEQPGFGEEQAAFAVLGVDIETLGMAVGRQWGLDDELLQMMRRVAPDAGVRRPDSDAEMLRLVSSAANDAVDIVSRAPSGRAGMALVRLAQRYGRALGGVSGGDLLAALQAGREALRDASAVDPGRLGADRGSGAAPELEPDSGPEMESATAEAADVAAVADADRSTPLEPRGGEPRHGAA